MIPYYCTDKTKVYISYWDGVIDKAGETSFDMFWWQENYHAGPQWRAQCFHADPTEYIRGNHKHGITVVELLRGRFHELPPRP